MTTTEKIDMSIVNEQVDALFENEVAKQELAEQMLIGIYQDNGERPLQESELAVLRAAGLVHGESFRQDTQVRAAFGRARRLIKQRAEAGLGGEYEKLKQELPERKAKNKAKVDDLSAQVEQLQRQIRAIEGATAADEAKLAQMESAREHLRSEAPQHVDDEVRSRKQSIRLAIGAEYREWKTKLDHAEIIVSLPADPRDERVINFCTPTMAKPVEPLSLLDEARANGLLEITNHIPEGQDRGTRERSVNPSGWAELQRTAKQALPELRETTAALKADRDEQMVEAEAALDYYLQDNPWG